MATLVDISQTLGDYMLKGWVLTDKKCPTAGCTVPLLRSPTGRTPVTSFCAKCANGQPPAVSASPASIDPVQSTKESSDASSTSQSRSSTPPTEVSDVPGSPIFAPPPETDASRRRREQSDRASSEIGKKLLQGWAMLGEECINENCYGVPLIRPPKAGGEKDPRKECVICGRVYVTEVDWAGRESLRLLDNAPQPPPKPSSTQRPPQPAIEDPIVVPYPQPASRPVTQIPGRTADAPPPPVEKQSTFTRTASTSLSKAPYHDLISLSRNNLEKSLQVLNQHLEYLIACPSLDVVSIGNVAEAIEKTAKALGQLKSN
ncbi:hypothetical protein CVT24_008344 [Panaeolus cyanescens]|uniref:Uncharacterized protein n=1 Tax=Panaeolus cyanescens TaxID=181874 RepID=A0A409VEY9_9AGAR|nr:hypothetical protein CVT24_008344 [Panaeolus cyanescens]